MLLKRNPCCEYLILFALLLLISTGLSEHLFCQ